jgi:hypothetical protein
MSPACPVETHVSCFRKERIEELRCHRLVRWSLTLAATKERIEELRDATGLSGGVSRWLLRKERIEELRDATGLSGGVSR